MQPKPGEVNQTSMIRNLIKLFHAGHIGGQTPAKQIPINRQTRVVWYSDPGRRSLVSPQPVHLLVEFTIMVTTDARLVYRLDRSICREELLPAYKINNGQTGYKPRIRASSAVAYL